MQRHTDLIVTGIPRSGTTLTTALIDSLDDSLGLSEPQWHLRFIRESSDARDYVQRICHDFRIVREDILAGRSVPDKRSVDGSSITNYFVRHPDGAITNQYEIYPVTRHGLSPHFLLAMKHTAAYTSILPQLIEHTDIPVLAVIRHPIPTILSWRSLHIPISHGRLPAAARFWPETKQLRKSYTDLLRIQVELYGLFCSRFEECSSRIILLKYEELIHNQYLVASTLKRRPTRSLTIQDHNRNAHYTHREVDLLKNYLQRYCRIAYSFYPELEEY